MQEKHSYPIPPPSCPKYPVQSHYNQLSLSDNSSGYEQTLRKNNMQLTEL